MYETANFSLVLCDCKTVCFGCRIAVRTSTICVCEKNWKYQIRKASEQNTYRGIPHYLSNPEGEYRSRRYI
jgi:hypothetical protein